MFPQVDYPKVQYYPHGQLSLASGPVAFDEAVYSEGCILPVGIWRRDLLLLGQYYSWTDVQVSTPNRVHGQISSFTPIAAWAHQFGHEDQGGVFFAPTFSRGHNFAGYNITATESYSGAVGLHWTSDHLAWFYGAIYQQQGSRGLFLPYAGVFWQPDQVWSFSLVVPWPAVSFAPTKDFYLRFGLSPAGAVFDRSLDGRHVSVSHSSWNLMLSPNFRVWRSLWLSGAAGLSNFGSLTVSTDGHVTLASKLARRVVWQLQLSFKP